MQLALLNILELTSWWQEHYIHEIIEGLYLGAQKEEDPLPFPVLQKFGVTYVLELLDEPLFSRAPPRVPTGIKYLPIALRNSRFSNIIPLLEYTSVFIREGLSKKRNVLVCSTHGNSRSAIIVAGYLMNELKISALDALYRVSSSRSSINPNDGFMAQLLEYEPILKAHKRVETGASSSSYQMRTKRTRECDDQSHESSRPAGLLKRRTRELMS